MYFVYLVFSCCISRWNFTAVMDFGGCFVMRYVVRPDQVERWLWLISLRKVDGSRLNVVPWIKMARPALVDAKLMALLSMW